MVYADPCLLSLPPQDTFLAELLHSFKDHLVGYHEHDSLLDHKEEEALSEEDRKAAWAEYEAEKKVNADTHPLCLSHTPTHTHTHCIFTCTITSNTHFL